MISSIQLKRPYWCQNVLLIWKQCTTYSTLYNQDSIRPLEHTYVHVPSFIVSYPVRMYHQTQLEGTRLVGTRIKQEESAYSLSPSPHVRKALLTRSNRAHITHVHTLN